ncbi:serpin family protein [Paenibacillus tianjinensis]|uniref:Serpin family protein n=1 Tax=Paenibacillus tianjinensis TaxID=2810347 RepID=A0ABX7L9J3_9BACL|nr:serpin family protein [Paenibacillus tianjinensis]QSF44036.1 serpin family protein [Paenibacillus tianjinensis]
MNKILALLLSLLLLTSCSSAGSSMSFSERADAAKKLNSRLARQSNELGLKLFSQLREQSGGGRNLTISPYSISAALALAYNGSKGETAEELGKLLGYAPDELDQLNTSEGALLPLLNDAGPGIQLELANSVWANQDIPLRKGYLKASEDYYDAQIRTADLAGEKSVKEINEWVSDHTSGKIDRMLEQPPGAQSVAVLVNALYFKGGWKKVFLEGNTHPDDFYPASGPAVEVPLMNQAGHFLYAEDKDWQAVRLPYGEGQMHMIVILPAKDSSLNTLLNHLAKDGLPSDDQFSGKQGSLSLPRFTASYGTDLKEAVQALGVKLAFDPRKGDFSALADTGTPIFISSIIHKTYIDVNESGTEAAASTLVGMLAGAASPAEAPFEMIVNRPFIYIIEDIQTGVWLFMGAIENPLLTE